MQAKDVKISVICSLHLIHPGDNLSPTLLEGAVSRSYNQFHLSNNMLKWIEMKKKNI